MTRQVTIQRMIGKHFEIKLFANGHVVACEIRDINTVTARRRAREWLDRYGLGVMVPWSKIEATGVIWGSSCDDAELWPTEAELVRALAYAQTGDASKLFPAPAKRSIKELFALFDRILARLNRPGYGMAARLTHGAFVSAQLEIYQLKKEGPSGP